MAAHVRRTPSRAGLAARSHRPKNRKKQGCSQLAVSVGFRHLGPLILGAEMAKSVLRRFNAAAKKRLKRFQAAAEQAAGGILEMRYRDTAEQSLRGAAAVTTLMHDEMRDIESANETASRKTKTKRKRKAVKKRPAKNVKPAAKRKKPAKASARKAPKRKARTRRTV